jgi:hypothetical protein
MLSVKFQQRFQTLHRLYELYLIRLLTSFKMLSVRFQQCFQTLRRLHELYGVQ